MNWKIIGILFIVITCLAGATVIFLKVMQTTEGYKTLGNSYYFTNEPHFGFLSGGCNRYVVPEEKR
jgi:hypothetical protein